MRLGGHSGHLGVRWQCFDDEDLMAEKQARPTRHAKRRLKYPLPRVHPSIDSPRMSVIEEQFSVNGPCAREEFLPPERGVPR